MSFSEFIDYGASLALLVLATVEAIKYGFLKAWFKRLAEKQGWELEQAADYYTAVLTVLSVAVGIFVALGAGERANILSQLGYTSVSPFVGIVMTGVLISFGDKVFHTIMDFGVSLVESIKVWRDKASQDLYNASGVVRK